MANKKAASALQKGKVYGMHSKLISLASRGGANPLENPTLFTAIEKAKKDSVPKDFIEKAIRRGAWLDKDASAIEEIIYEWMAPGWIGIIIRALTDNRNRTASNIRSYFTKNGGNLWETGSLSNHMFIYRGVYTLDPKHITEDQIIESWCDDYSIWEKEVRVICQREQFSSVGQSFTQNTIDIITSGFEYIPNMEIEITDFEQGVRVMKLLSDLDNDDDVEKVWTNGIFDDILRSKVENFLDSQSFRS